MIQDFLSSWPLFHDIYLTGWLAAAALSLIGVPVVARSQIFAGAALSEASTLGIALAMWASALLGASAPAWMESDAFLSAVAVLLSVGASLLASGRAGPGRERREAMTAWIFLLGAAGSILIVSRSPHGLDEVQRLLSSSIIGATAADAWIFGGLFAAAAAALLLGRNTVLLWMVDPPMAAAAGVPVRALEFGFSVLLGLAVGLAIRASGMLYTFGALVLPALAARTVAREIRTMLVLTPTLALGCAVAGFVIANHLDFPPSQLTITLLCAAVPAGAVAARMRHRSPA
ncbi:MAG: metal ABC transporter permease [Phycisphaerales bacterium]|nr:metal ABC transporter permease [Phycisphaerales bacterium]